MMALLAAIITLTNQFGTVEIDCQTSKLVSYAPKADAKDLALWEKDWLPLLRVVRSTADGALEPCYLYVPEAAQREPVPLLVGFHTWSFDWGAVRTCQWLLTAAKKRGWALVCPNFRGRNDHPAACGSDLAVQDVVDAVAYAKCHVNIDASRVYVTGSSGGGHLTLLMVSRHPGIFAAGAAFCPISDLARWHAESLVTRYRGRSRRYAKMMEMACGGTPEERAEEYAHRSPLTYLAATKAAGVPVYIATGIHDGHVGSVPVGHATRAFNALCKPGDAIPEDVIARIEETGGIPAGMRNESTPDPFYIERNRIHFRRTSGNVRFTLFEGGHSSNSAAGFDFLSRQRKGQPADWTLPATAAEAGTEGVSK